MRRGARVGWAVLAATSLFTFPLGSVAQESEAETIRAEVLEVVPDEGSAVLVGGRRYGGSVRVSGHASGLAVVETVSLDDYLSGIQEVPFTWEPEALRAQAIAARTYLAWNLNRGRTDSGRRYDYDICATDACQVYAGLEPRLAESGDRWLEAVRSTDAQVLLFEGEPAVTYYSSTSGGRTRTVSDVWPDIDHPYLQAVDSPGEESPFAEWSWFLPSRVMGILMRAAGLGSGALGHITSEVTDDGTGPWTVSFVSDGGTETIDTWSLRNALNRVGSASAPALLPSRRDDGRRYPQTILSPSYTITTYRLPVFGPGIVSVYEVEGRGWGHLVGMSQYGAQAMAKAGAGAEEILSHFYTGLELVESHEYAPDSVDVVLAIGADALELDVTGPVTVSVDGQEVAAEELGSWEMTAASGSIEVTSPVGLGLSPRLRPGRFGLSGGRLVLRPELTTAALVQWTLIVDGQEVAGFGPERLDAGLLTIPLPIGAESGRLTIAATNSHGGHTVDFEFDSGETG